MRTILFFPFLLIVLTSCNSKSVSEDVNDDGAVKRILVELKQMEEEESFSRLSVVVDENIIYSWQAKDTIGVFPQKGGQVEFPISDADAGKSSAIFDGGAWALRSEHTYSAYYPYNFYNRNVEEIPYSYLGQIRDASEANEWAHLRNYLYFAAPPATVTSGALSFSLSHLGALLKLTMTFPTPATYTALTIYTDAEVLPVKKTVDLTGTALIQKPVYLSDGLTVQLKNVQTTVADEEVTVWIAFPSVSEGSHPLKVVVYDEDGFAYTSDIKKNTGEAAYASFTANKWQRRFAVPTLDESFNVKIGDWEDDGIDNGGTAE